MPTVIDCNKGVIHVTSTSKSCCSYDYKEFIELCDDFEVEEILRDKLWLNLKKECTDLGDDDYDIEYDHDDIPDDDAKGYFQETFEDCLREVEKEYERCHDCKKLLAPTVNIKIIQKESYEKTICDECCPDKTTMKAEGWTEVDADSDDDDESVEGCEQPYPETKDHLPKTKIDIDTFLDEDESVEGCEQPYPETKDHCPETKIDLVPDIKAPEAVDDEDADWFQGMGVVKDFFKDRKIVTDELEKAKELTDELYLKYRMAKINANVITEVAKAFDDLATITENSNIFVRKSVVNRMEELLRTLCGVCKSPL
jgi:hypothetical protein